MEKNHWELEGGAIDTEGLSGHEGDGAEQKATTTSESEAFDLGQALVVVDKPAADVLPLPVFATTATTISTLTPVPQYKPAPSLWSPLPKSPPHLSPSHQNLCQMKHLKF
ncbi:hypothetical protein NDU88_007823 [Pleurodeles waltl]|uniref:Uncharacterized protein n=1 Tax=Pleurodeles waltl TaxID=8319 RepID=A0AAV7U2N5_PLEWA|nr:hypothetical protein NDU88_007823 [Pleurodeles waltl]